MFFWNSLAFLMIQWMLAIWSLVPLLFLNLSWTSGSSRFTYCWSMAWSFEHYFASMWDECNCAVVWAFFSIAFLWGLEWKLTLSSPVATAEFFKFAGILSAALSQHHLLGMLVENNSGWNSWWCWGLTAFAIFHSLRGLYVAFAQCST